MKLSTPYLKRFSRPTRRSECVYGSRPCPWVSCKYHLLWDVNQDKVNFKYMTDDEIIDYLINMKETCALDMAQKEKTLQEIAEVLELSRERVRQLSFWRSEFKGGLVELLKSGDFRKILEVYYGCQIKSSQSS